MLPTVSYPPYATSSRELTGDIMMSAQFEEGDLLSETQNLLSKTRDDAQHGNEFDDNSTISPLISEEEMDAMSSGNQSIDEPMSTGMLQDIRDGSQSHPSVNRREARYKIRDCIKLSEEEWKGELLST